MTKRRTLKQIVKTSRQYLYVVLCIGPNYKFDEETVHLVLIGILMAVYQASSLILQAKFKTFLVFNSVSSNIKLMFNIHSVVESAKVSLQGSRPRPAQRSDQRPLGTS